MPYVPTRKERIEDAMPYILPAVCGLIVLGLIGWGVWYQFGPKKTGKTNAPVAVTPDQKARAEQQRSFAADVASLEAAYEKAVESGAAAAVLDSLLTRTIDRQREVLKLEPRASGPEADKLARFEGLRGDLRAKTAAAESRALEQAADQDAARGAHPAALQKLRDALRLQREANSNAKTQDLIDLPRELRLTKLVEERTTDPLRETVAAARARAEAAAAAQDWGTALKAYQQARAAQVEFNSKSTENRSGNLAALEQLDVEIASLQAADLAAKVSATEKAAAAALAAGKISEAAADFATATRQQEELNERHPKSRFASAEKVTELAIQRETALSTETLGRITALDREVTALLKRRDPAGASAKIAEVTALVARAATEFPRSRALDPALRRKLEYLEIRRADLAAIQEQVYGAVAVVPGSASAVMLRTEVPQDLYLRVMNTNPSRNQARGLPVDSVSWLDAREFCERLSWLLGAQVRLPREEEFRAIWKGAISGQEWSADNAAGRSREAGRAPASAAGFHDVAGNLAEWLELPRDDGGTMPVAGGSFLDPAATLAKLPIELVEKRTRARHIGFRFVIEK
jgi:hypothetical protein